MFLKAKPDKGFGSLHQMQARRKSGSAGALPTDTGGSAGGAPGAVTLSFAQLNCRAVLRRWQFAQRTSHLASFARAVAHPAFCATVAMSVRFVAGSRWSNSRMAVSEAPQSTQGCERKYASTNARFLRLSLRVRSLAFALYFSTFCT